MSDRWLTFDPVFSFGPFLGTILCLSIFFIWLEWKKPSRHLSLRIITLFIMVASLCALFLRPSYRTLHSSTNILLTPRYDTKKVDSLLNLERNAALIHTPGTNGYKNSRTITSLHEILTEHVEINYILGQGLSPGELDLVQPANYTFIPASHPSGIIHLKTQQPVRPKRSNTIEGIFNHAKAGTILYLEGPGGKEDSIVLAGKKYERFKLKFTPKQAGKFTYTLTANDTLKETLPVHVLQPKPLNILFIQHYPTYESRYLKNFLIKDHSLALRYRLSRNRYRYESINRKQQRINKLTDELLSDFDLLIIDSDELNSLSSSEVSDVNQSIKNGLGVLTLFNGSPVKTKVSSSLLPFAFHSYQTDTAHIYSGTKKLILPAWPVKTSPGILVTPVVKNKNRIVSGYCHNGFGKTAFQLLQQTYQLMLKGDSLSYSQLWSGLIENTARTKRSKFSITIPNAFPIYADEPHTIQIIAAGTEPTLLHDGIRIPLMEDLFIDGLWSGKFWANEPGWHTLALAEDSTALPYYVFEKNSWKSLSITNNIEQTLLKSAAVPKEKKLEEVSEPVPSWIFYFLFLVSAGFLWLLPKV